LLDEPAGRAATAAAAFELAPEALLDTAQLVDSRLELPSFPLTGRAQDSSDRGRIPAGEEVADLGELEAEALRLLDAPQSR
jgi:hypothetical protein